MLSGLWQTIIGLSPLLIYSIIALLVALECSAFLGLVIPGETSIILGGFLASQGHLHLATLMIVASLAAIIGDTVGYWFGSAKGTRWALAHGGRIGVTKERFERARLLIKRFGGPAVFLGRFTSVARAFVPFMAGSLRLPYPTFLAFNVVGGVIWACLFSYLGYLFGSQWEQLARRAGLIGGVVALCLIAAAVILYRGTRTHDA